MKTKLLIVLVCLFIYIPTTHSQCVAVPNQNTIYGSVFNDTNQNGNKGTFETGANGISVNLYQDNNGDGFIDSGDVIINSATSNVSGDYTFVIPETTTTNNVRDYFNSTSYSNNNGSENWTNSWQELGESNGVNDGNIQVDNNKLRFGQDEKDNKNMNGDGADRIVDLSTYTSATLSFNFTRDIDKDDKGVDWSVKAQISTNGTTYTTLGSFDYNDTQTAYSYDISSYISATTHIRFVGSGYREDEKNYLFFDNIDVDYTKTNIDNLNYIVALDETALAPGITITSNTFNAIAFTAFGQANCHPQNDFGIYICGPNCSPLAVNDNATIDQGDSVTIAVLDNDSDGDDNIDVDTLDILSEPSNGSVSIDDFGNIIYIPNGSYIGTDSFTYEICDTTLPTKLCGSATVNITINENVVDPCYQAVQPQTFYIPFPDDELRTALSNSDSGSCSIAVTSDVSRIVSIKTPYPGSIITYDHWEDGYEADINNPVQPTTQVWGDKDISNGTAPEYDDDFIPSGGDIVLENTYNFNPRNSSIIVYDGKDKIYTSNDISLSVIAGDLDRFGVQLAKTDVYNLEKFGTAFSVPFGEDLGQEFQYTSLFIRASENSTLVNVDLDNDGTIDNTATLNEGEVMFVDGGVNSGAKITSDKPVGVDLFFGDLDCYGTRQINLYPGKFYGDTYYSPVPTVNAAAPSVVYFFNSLNRSINIDWNSNSNSGILTVPAKSSASISLSDNSGYKFKSQLGDSYVAIQVVDSDASGRSYDWAFNLISEARLTDFASIAWAPGSAEYANNYNPVWVTPTANTTLYIKYDGDLTDASALVSPCGIPYDQSLNVNALNYTQIFDTFNNDNDQSGLSVFTCDGTKIFAVFGQDASLAPPASDSMDVGTSMQPMCLNPLVIANDDSGYGLVDVSIDIPVSDNDTAFLTTLNIGSITTTGLLQPQNGFLIVNPNGTITYTPNNGYVGMDTFEYSICSVEFPGVCDTATVTVNIALCAIPFVKNVIYGQVYFDLNEDLVNNDDIGIEGADVKIYNDINVNGAVDTGDVLLKVLTTNVDGFYDYEVPNYNVTIREKFSSLNYSGGTGWSTNWIEVGDDGNPLTGDVQIQGSKRRLLVDNNSAIYRSADLSGLANANISFSIREYGGLESDDDVLVQICTDNSFSNCQTLFIKANDFGSETVNGLAIDADKLTSTSTFRVVTNGYTSSSERLFIDNIRIRFAVSVENLVMETDLTSLPAGYSFSTDNVEVANFLPQAFGYCEKNNDFGLLRCNLLESNIVYDCDDNGTPFDVADDFYNIILNPVGTRLGATYTVSGDITDSGTYGTPKSFGPFPTTSGDKIITITDNTGNCAIEDIEISVSPYSCLDLTGGYTIDFDGVDDYLESDLDLGNFQKATVMAWVKLDPAFTNRGYVLSYGGLKLEVDDTRKAKFRVNHVYADFPQNIILDKDKWYHMALVFDSGLLADNLRAYVNGKFIGASSHDDLTSPITSEAVKFNIGKRSYDNNRYFKGCIDEVRVFDIPLSEDQLKKIIHQEIIENAGIVSGAVIPKAINDDNTSASIPWANLKAYYPMTDIISGSTSDFSGNDYSALLKNITTIQAQTAPMPFKTSADGDINNPNTWLHGGVWDMDALSDTENAIVQIDHDVTINKSFKTLGLVVSSGKTLTVNGDNLVSNSWYLELNGTLDLMDDSQLIQGTQSDLVTSIDGKLLRRQEGTSNPFRYNYWSSPIGATSVSALLDNNAAVNNPNNSNYSLNLLNDESGVDMPFTSQQTSSGNISSAWLYSFINGVTYNNWKQLAPTSIIKPGVGYTQKGTGTVAPEQQYIFEGKPNNGTILIDVVDVGGDGSVPAVTKTSYLLGNPYASALDLHKFIDDNADVTDGTIQLWQQWSGNSHYLNEYEGGYAQINKTGSIRAFQFVGKEGATTGVLIAGAVKPSRYLPVGQGFVTEIKKDGKVEFNNSQRVFIKEADADGTYNNGSTFFKGANTSKSKSNSIAEQNTATEFQKIRLELNSVIGPKTRRELLIGFSPETTDGYDYGYDAENAEVSNNDLQLNLDGKDMNILAFSEITDDKVIPLNFKSSGSNTFEIKVTETENIPDGQAIYLKDNLTGTYFDLTEDMAYGFSSGQGIFNNRFEIVFQNEKQSLSTEETLSTENFIYFQNSTNTLFVKKLNSNVSKLSLVNMRGQVVFKMADITSEELENGLQFTNVSTGAYVVCMRTDTNVLLTKKIIMK